jgi:hypothetical protein
VKNHEVKPDISTETNHICRTCGQDVEWTFATDWRHIEDFWYRQKSPSASGYGWLLSQPLWVMLLEKNGAALVWDDDKKHSAILNTRNNNLILTVNDEVINWGNDYSPLMSLLITAREVRGSMLKRMSFEPITRDELWITELENGARPGPGQKENNFVNKLTCGHEVDAEEELPHGKIVHCSVHGHQSVLNPTGKEINPGEGETTSDFAAND